MPLNDEQIEKIKMIFEDHRAKGVLPYQLDEAAVKPMILVGKEDIQFLIDNQLKLQAAYRELSDSHNALIVRVANLEGEEDAP